MKQQFDCMENKIVYVEESLGHSFIVYHWDPETIFL